MNPIEEIKSRLRKYPHARWEIHENRITVFPGDEDGFSVSLVDNAPHYTVSFDAWHEEYEGAEEALNAFAFGLSEDCRLKIDYRGSQAHVWNVEEKDGNGEWFPCQWIGCNEMGLLAPPLFWLKKRCEYRQNTWIKSEPHQPSSESELLKLS